MGDRDNLETRMRAAAAVVNCLDDGGGFYVEAGEAAEIAAEAVEEERKRTKAHSDRREALERLLACYRSGCRPSEALFREMDRTRAALASLEGDAG